MHVTITKCLDCWFSVDVAASMLVDKLKSVPLRFGENVFASFAKKTKQTQKHCNVYPRLVNQQPATRPPCHFPAFFGTVNFFEGMVSGSSFFFELLCDHSYETFLAILSHGTICFSAFYVMKFLEQYSSNLYLLLIHYRSMAIWVTSVHRTCSVIESLLQRNKRRGKNRNKGEKLVPGNDLYLKPEKIT